MKYFTKWETIVDGLYKTITTKGEEYHILAELENGRRAKPPYKFTLFKRYKDKDGIYRLKEVPTERPPTMEEAQALIE